MAQTPSPEEVETGDDYYHVRYRDPDDFDDIRTPDWADHAADSVVEGSEVRTGDTEGDDDWETQSVLIPIDAVDDEDAARDAADDVVAKIAE